MIYDLLIVGGGINGTGIARDAAGRGLRVLLCEQDDLAQGTSSRSTKMIHGGLRYLEQYEFRLVREALNEREVMLRIAPHIVWPLRIVIPHSRQQRPAWLLRLGLILYDRLGTRTTLPASRRLDLRRAPEGAAVQPSFHTAFEYSDCWVDDSRLVVLNALDAAARGADIRVHTQAIAARREPAAWAVTLRNTAGEQTVHARALVNAAGPWVDQVLRGVAGRNAESHIRMVKGSHLVVRKFWDGPHAFLLQNDDRRVIFVCPYQGSLALIGTTDIPFTGPPERVAVDPAERDYLLRATNRVMRVQLSGADVLTEFAGIRPLYDDAAASASTVTRDYRFDLDESGPKLLSIFGGKITTYRKLAEHALARLGTPGAPWTATAPLPGGDMPAFGPWLAAFQGRHPWLPPALAAHYARLYGTRAEALLGTAAALPALGQHFGGQLYAREAEFLRQTEWASSAEDVLDRRTKHGLHLTAAQRAAFTAWFGPPA